MPIPSLTDRQYVVDKNKRSAHQVKAEREVFWYREELLKRVTATWVEVSGVGPGCQPGIGSWRIERPC